MQVTIEAIKRTQRQSKAGKPYESVSILANQRWYGGFGGKWNEHWQKGDTVEIEVTQNGEYFNFERPDPLKKLETRISLLEEQVAKLSQNHSVAPTIDDHHEYVGQPTQVGRTQVLEPTQFDDVPF